MKIKGILLIFGLVSIMAAQMPWPHPPQNQVWPVGNSWGIFQDYGGSPYVHNGDDIMVPALHPVTAVKYGYVKAIWNSGTYYMGISVADSAGAAFCSGYQYYHVDGPSIQVQVGDTVYVSDTIARIVTWPVAGFNHDHYSKNRNSGTVWTSYGGYFKNPLVEVAPDTDRTIPVFTNAVSGRIFGITSNQTSTYLNPDSIYGNVDFICRVEDKMNHNTWWVAVYKLVYSIRDTVGNYVIPPMLSVQFSESLDSYTTSQVRTIYKDDATCNSNCNYDSLNRRLYYIFTNTDGDSTIEYTDSMLCWQTTTVPNGPYWVKVVASDEYGNARPESMLVRVKNPVGIEEAQQASPEYGVIITCSPNPARGDIIVRVNKFGSDAVKLAVYDAAGKMVRSLTASHVRNFPCDVRWDRRDDQGRLVAAGCYFISPVPGVVSGMAKLILVE